MGVDKIYLHFTARSHSISSNGDNILMTCMIVHQYNKISMIPDAGGGGGGIHHELFNTVYSLSTPIPTGLIKVYFNVYN